MPRESVEGSAYPSNWKELATAVKEAAGWRCIRCDHPHDTAAGYTLTVHHANLDPGCSAWWNLLALCQRCHLAIQAKVDLNRPWVMAEHSDWFKPYVAGFYAFKYLGLELSRTEVIARLDELLAIERAVVLGAAT
jgi:hypothetical protein